jgi:hypothetical protein
MDEAEGMSERERVMWHVLREVIETLSREGHGYHLSAVLYNAQVELRAISEKEEKEELLLSDIDPEDV